MDKPNYVKWIALGIAWIILLRDWFGPTSSEIRDAERGTLLFICLAAYFLFARQDKIFDRLHHDNMSLVSALTAARDEVQHVKKVLRHKLGVNQNDDEDDIEYDEYDE